jgi:hypothetical protein
MQCRRAELSIGGACAVGLCDDPGLDALAVGSRNQIDAAMISYAGESRKRASPASLG